MPLEEDILLNLTHRFGGVALHTETRSQTLSLNAELLKAGSEGVFDKCLQSK